MQADSRHYIAAIEMNGMSKNLKRTSRLYLLLEILLYMLIAALLVIMVNF
jgi:hypothetical protein